MPITQSPGTGDMGYTSPMIRHRATLLLTLALLFAASAFAVAAPPAPPLPLEQWFTLTLFGRPAGYGRWAATPTAEGFRLETELHLTVRHQGREKTTELRGVDETGPDLSLRSFSHQQTLDGVPSRQRGRVDGGVLVVELLAAGRSEPFRHVLSGPLHPESAAPLLPSRAPTDGDSPYLVYSVSAQQPVAMTQRVEPSPGGWLVFTRSMGEEVKSFLDPQGRVVREETSGGRILSEASPRERALAHWEAARGDKGESFLAATRIPLDAPLPTPETIRGLTLLVENVTGSVPEEGAGQFCRREASGFLCRTRHVHPGEAPSAAPAKDLRPALAATPFLQADAPAIVEAARQATAPTASPWETVKTLTAWVHRRLGKSGRDVGTALDALREGEADCQGHALLYTALARAAGVPSRVANGIVYDPGSGGFTYHSWAESYVGGQWIPVDPTFGQAPADALRLRISTGEGGEAHAPLLSWLGAARLRVLTIAR